MLARIAGRKQGSHLSVYLLQLRKQGPVPKLSWDSKVKYSVGKLSRMREYVWHDKIDKGTWTVYCLLFLSLVTISESASTIGFYILQASDGRHTHLRDWQPVAICLAVACITLFYLFQGTSKQWSRVFIDISAISEILIWVTAIVALILSYFDIGPISHMTLSSLDRQSPLSRAVGAFHFDVDMVLHIAFEISELEYSSSVGTTCVKESFAKISYLPLTGG